MITPPLQALIPAAGPASASASANMGAHAPAQVNATPSRFASLLGQAAQAQQPARPPSPVPSPAPSPAPSSETQDGNAKQTAADDSPSQANSNNSKTKLQQTSPARQAGAGTAPRAAAKASAADAADSDAAPPTSDQDRDATDKEMPAGGATVDVAALVATLAQRSLHEQAAQAADTTSAAVQTRESAAAPALLPGLANDKTTLGTAPLDKNAPDVATNQTAPSFATQLQTQTQAQGQAGATDDAAGGADKPALLDPDIIFVTPDYPGPTAAGANPPPLQTTAAATEVYKSQLSARPGSAEFGPQLGAQLSSFVRDGIHHAQLELNPAEMGPLTVQIQMDGNRAHLHVAAAHTDTRDALAQAMPQLASSLREAGLTLTGGGVSDQPRPQDQPSTRRGPERGPKRNGSEIDDTPLAPRAELMPRRRGVVDLRA